MVELLEVSILPIYPLDLLQFLLTNSMLASKNDQECDSLWFKKVVENPGQYNWRGALFRGRLISRIDTQHANAFPLAQI
jgi:hypothetical protein